MRLSRSELVWVNIVQKVEVDDGELVDCDLEELLAELDVLGDGEVGCVEREEGVVLRRRWSKGLDEDSHLVDEPKKNQRIANMSQ